MALSVPLLCHHLPQLRLPDWVNQHFLKAWQDVHPEGSKNRGLLSLMRRHEWRLKPEQRENLQRYLSDWSYQSLMDTSFSLLCDSFKFVRANAPEMLMSTDRIVERIDVI